MGCHAIALDLALALERARAQALGMRTGHWRWIGHLSNNGYGQVLLLCVRVRA